MERNKKYTKYMRLIPLELRDGDGNILVCNRCLPAGWACRGGRMVFTDGSSREHNPATCGIREPLVGATGGEVTIDGVVMTKTS